MIRSKYFLFSCSLSLARPGNCLINASMVQKYDNRFLDLMGRAILDYQTGNDPQDIVTETDISEPDVMPVAYLFRNFESMPEIEKRALGLCRGKILDVGCGAGSHALFLQEKGFDVSAIDISPLAVEACRLRGLKDVRVKNIMELSGEKFDTLLLLMNGTGICGKIRNLVPFLLHIKSLLTDDGRILIDSSDIRYMYDTDDDGGIWLPADKEYFGQLRFEMAYKGKKELPFDWLYADQETLSAAAGIAGLEFTKICDGGHFDYLAQLTVK